MPAYSFEALDAQGHVRRGTLEADSPKAARSLLRAQALVPLDVEALAAGAESIGGVRVSLYDLEGGESGIFTDLIEEADGLAFGSPTINADAVKPIWDVLSSLTTVNVKGKLGAAFGSYGWSGEAVRLIEDRLRGLKLRVPVEGLRIKLVPDAGELAQCHALGETLARHLTGQVEHREIEFSALQASPA